MAAVGPVLPPWAAHLTPWGYYALARPAEYRGPDLVAVPPWSVSVAALGAVAAAVFVLGTAHLDRREG